jgi:hypothetical protein
MHCYTLTELIKFPYYKKPVKNEAKESILEKKGVMSLHAPQSRNRGGAFLLDVAITVYHIVTICMKLDPDMHIGLHLVSFGKSGVTTFIDGSHLRIC